MKILNALLSTLFLLQLHTVTPSDPQGITCAMCCCVGGGAVCFPTAAISTLETTLAATTSAACICAGYLAITIPVSCCVYNCDKEIDALGPMNSQSYEQNKTQLRRLLKRHISKEEWPTFVKIYEEPVCNLKVATIKSYYDSHQECGNCRTCCWPILCGATLITGGPANKFPALKKYDSPLNAPQDQQMEEQSMVPGCQNLKIKNKASVSSTMINKKKK